MKFFHVYNDWHIKALEKNGLLNRDSGFKIQHVFSMTDDIKFNKYAAKGSAIHSLIKGEKIPFYVDRIAGGCTYHEYDFDKSLIKEYRDILGDWFLGFQLHESGSNRRNCDWDAILQVMNGDKGPYDVNELRARTSATYERDENGELLPTFFQDLPEVYAKMRYADTPADFIKELREFYTRKMEKVDGLVLPCDSYYMATKIHDDLGMKTFMPEVGCQIPLMRQQIALARGMAKAKGKTWGAYYECWREIREDGNAIYSMPCFNTHSSNEWYLDQSEHPDDFTSHGENGGSSRYLQNRIYFYALMAGADYFSEEWGLNCSYTDMEEFTLSDYGRVKKDFINTALDFRGIRAEVPFAIVLPTDYACMELPEIWDTCEFGNPRDTYMRCVLSDSEKKYYGHIEDVLKLAFARTEVIGNEGHTITNSRFGDIFDIVYADTNDEALSKYAYLIDATPEGSFAKKAGNKFKVLESADIGKLEAEIKRLAKEVMPAYVSDLCWLVSTDENGKRYLSIFNNEGNERSLKLGNTLHREADKRVTISFKDKTTPHILKEALGSCSLERIDDNTFEATIPAAGFVIIGF